MPKPSTYKQEVHDNLAWALALDGRTDEEIAKDMGISTRTLHKWKKKYPSFEDSLKRAKNQADAEVVKTLYRRALGYSFKEKKVVVENDVDGNPKPIKIETIERDVPPDTTAIIFWLKNRHPEAWRDKKDVNVTDDSHIEALKSLAKKYDDEDRGPKNNK